MKRKTDTERKMAEILARTEVEILAAIEVASAFKQPELVVDAIAAAGAARRTGRGRK